MGTITLDTIICSIFNIQDILRNSTPNFKQFNVSILTYTPENMIHRKLNGTVFNRILQVVSQSSHNAGSMILCTPRKEITITRSVTHIVITASIMDLPGESFTYL
jgi:hypothetical protein